MKIDRFEGPYAYLSNFFLCEVKLEGITYPSTEHAFQAYKTTDKELRKWIATLRTPSAAKKAGRDFQLRPDWEDIKINVMRGVCYVKFLHPHLRRMLVSTHPAELIEGNTWGDRFWGMVNGQGKNHLGRILMEIRDYYIQLDLTIICKAHQQAGEGTIDEILDRFKPVYHKKGE